MSASVPSTPAKPADSISWKNIIVLLVVFTAGILTGVVTQFADRCPLLNPPAPASNAARSEEECAMDRYRMAVRQEQTDYIRKIQEWKKPYAEKVTAVLTPEQKTQLDALRKSRARGRQGVSGAPGMPPGAICEMEDARFYDYPGFYVKNDRLARVLTGVIAYQSEVDRLSQKVNLADKQKAAVTKILAQRRDDLIKYVDQNPLPKTYCYLNDGDDLASDQEI